MSAVHWFRIFFSSFKHLNILGPIPNISSVSVMKPQLTLSKAFSTSIDRNIVGSLFSLCRRSNDIRPLYLPSLPGMYPI
ncbi:unnamed protein product [Staurois parvus]|uniref:Uncharacterized protein n=1 Tax=Staurois parvus TaxID=386267 RepID=A0ABN9DGH2_9NEOB|nr:unnamed protein product [Staurois parvus]